MTKTAPAEYRQLALGTQPFAAWHPDTGVMLDSIRFSRKEARRIAGTYFNPQEPIRGWDLMYRRGWRIVPVKVEPK